MATTQFIDFVKFQKEKKIRFRFGPLAEEIFFYKYHQWFMLCASRMFYDWIVLLKEIVVFIHDNKKEIIRILDEQTLIHDGIF